MLQHDFNIKLNQEILLTIRATQSVKNIKWYLLICGSANCISLSATLVSCILSKAKISILQEHGWPTPWSHLSITITKLSSSDALVLSIFFNSPLGMLNPTFPRFFHFLHTSSLEMNFNTFSLVKESTAS